DVFFGAGSSILLFQMNRVRAWAIVAIVTAPFLLAFAFGTYNYMQSVPARTASVPFDPVADAVRTLLRPRSAAFFVPSPVRRDEPIEAVLEIGPPDATPEEVQIRLESYSARLGVGASGHVDVAPRMVANLVADRDCTITPKDSVDRAVGSNP